MKIFSSAKSGLKRIFGTNEIVGNYDSIKGLAKGIYEYDTKLVGHTGKPYVVYVPTDLVLKREREFRNLFFLFFGILVTSIFYFFYVLFHHLWLTAVLILSFSMFVSALSFRYHFWWFQMRKRKLGCTFEEWKDETLNDLSRRK